MRSNFIFSEPLASNMRIYLLLTVITLSTVSTVSSAEWSADWITSTAGWVNEPGWAYPGGDLKVGRKSGKKLAANSNAEDCRKHCLDQHNDEAKFFTFRQGCQMAKFDPFLSLDCAWVEGVGAQSKERKESNFAIWQPWRRSLARSALPDVRPIHIQFQMRISFCCVCRPIQAATRFCVRPKNFPEQPWVVVCYISPRWA